MANKGGHRRFGNMRRLPSGRYQVRYPGPDGLPRTAPETFARKGEAERYLSIVEAQLARHEWVDPDRAKIRLQDYAERWISHRPNLRPRTVALYTWLLGRYVTPYLGGVPLGRLDTPMVREWRATLLGNGVSATMTAKAYRLLRAVLMTAVNEDELIRKNPCRIPGADQEKASERPVLNMAQVFALADQVGERYRALILVATFGCLRWGEVAALQRQDINASTGVNRVRQAFTELRGVGMVLGPPKSRAGRRAVSVPAAILPVLRAHLGRCVGEGPDALVFTGPNGAAIRRGNFNKLTKWSAAVAAIGAAGLHFHDLRHTGNTLAARTGASTKELMARMGHDSAQAALIYQHATAEADRAIAEAVNDAVKAEQRRGKKAPKRERKRRGDPDDGAAGMLAKVS
ncbi:tyrosine-type recombinase/integrase [Phytohabitans houttuyneae]|uniref:Putative prophage phiRv2 integrase n=1 Tax=Phytohabitans houttuyneae TaxID=1076126 RepID=A0A6V8K3T2_9ACTN|nr:site-specific integrase [Phytohabitans houttuyneae]GFJ79812.1 putative prophage phiRv2 integrase [Phytohabitans houttuyneae]